MMMHPALTGLTALPLEAQLLELQYAATAPKINLAAQNPLALPAVYKALKCSTASSSKISNITNNTDPHSINSRIFVGNLNTFVITKDDVETIFKRYGRLIGISMHKGYAFIQYTCEQDARNAVRAEDQRVYATQPIDVNMASEPKPNRPSRKRQNGVTNNKSVNNLIDVSNLSPPLKQARPEGHAGSPPPRLQDKAKEAAGGDILICGNCKKDFADIHELSAHKAHGCTHVTPPCKCLQGLRVGGHLVCATCKSEFFSSWDLLQHCQFQHRLAIFIDNPKPLIGKEGSEEASPEQPSPEVHAGSEHMEDAQVNGLRQETQPSPQENNNDEGLSKNPDASPHYVPPCDM